MQTLIRIFLSCLLLTLQAGGFVFAPSSEFENDCESSAPDDSSETETDDSIALDVDLLGRRPVRRFVAEMRHRRRVASVAAPSATLRIALRLLDRRVVVDRNLLLRC